MRRLGFLLAFLAVAGVCLLSGLVPRPARAACGETVYRDNDDAPIPEPPVDEEGDYILWDGVDSMVFKQVEKVLDLGFAGRKVGTWLGICGPLEAENVNDLDEVPDSTWFTNRHGWRRMGLEELRRGPNLTGGPDMTGTLTVIGGKGIGLSPGFLVEDGKGDRYLLKFDPPRYPELATATEMVASKFMYAAGYNVPEYYLIRLDPARLAIAEGALVTGKYKKKRPMTEEDLSRILARAARSEDGTYRAIASKLIPGAPKGPFRTTGRRKEDPNDTVFHENRRELRGLRVISAFINNTDSRRGNYLDVYEGLDPQGHLVHYLLDFSACMGSGNVRPKEAKYGNEYVVDPRNILLSFLSLGLWVKPWEEPAPVRFQSVGSFEAEIFSPGRWKTSYPNPMFQRMTPRDAFWAARIVTSFTDEEIRAVVETGEWSDPAAEAYVVQTFIARRDKIGRHWFDVRRINPLDRFRVEGWGETARLVWRDLGVARGLADPAVTRYRFRLAERIEGGRRATLEGGWRETVLREIPLGGLLSGLGGGGDREVCYGVVLRTSRDRGRRWSPPLVVRVRCKEPGGPYRVIALRRGD